MVVHALVLEVDAVDEDTVLGLLGASILGADAEDAADGRRIVRLYYPGPPDATAVERRLADAGIALDRLRSRVDPVPDEPWVERYQESLCPFPLGRRFWVDPTGRSGGAPGPDGRIAIRLVPGRAFGTGEHATTRLCAALLEDRVLPGTGWLDLGCGTAVLAVVAWHCGARPVLAVDNDPEAVLVARDVLRANGLVDRIALDEATARADLGSHWDGVVANLDESTLVGSAVVLAALLAPGGALVGSGFLASDATRVQSVIAAVGLVSVETRTDGDWAAVLWERR